MKCRKDAILEAYRSSQEQILALESELAQIQNESKCQIIPVQAYYQDFCNRCDIHVTECKALIDDFKTVYKYARKVELPSFIK